MRGSATSSSTVVSMRRTQLGCSGPVPGTFCGSVAPTRSSRVTSSAGAAEPASTWSTPSNIPASSSRRMPRSSSHWRRPSRERRAGVHRDAPAHLVDARRSRCGARGRGPGGSRRMWRCHGCRRRRRCAGRVRPSARRAPTASRTRRRSCAARGGGPSRRAPSRARCRGPRRPRRNPSAATRWRRPRTARRLGTGRTRPRSADGRPGTQNSRCSPIT